MLVFQQVCQFRVLLLVQRQAGGFRVQVLAQYGVGADSGPDADEVELPRSDRRFADPAWREQPVFALIHQTYLLLAERILEALDEVEGLGEQERERLRFATRSVIDAMSPANFPLTNPVVLERTIETRGENLAKGMERLARDLARGQLTHTDETQFRLGENIACTPGKVVHRTELFELIQYTPSTPDVLATPLVIFPPWINRFYILDLNPKKSFVKWAVDQGVSVFMVSWRSANENLADITWDDYVRAQIEVIEVVRERGRTSGDIALALLFYGGIAGGVLLMGRSIRAASSSRGASRRTESRAPRS